VNARLIDLVMRVARQSDGSPQGALIGLVSNVDERGRVQLKLPSIGPDIVTDWAPVALPMAGSNRAVSFTPKVNDQAIVVFLNGNWRTPVVIGFLSSTADPLPSAFTNGQAGVVLGDNKPRLTLNETSNDGGPGIAIDDGAGNRITIKTDGNTIEITAAGNIVLAAKDGKVSISAKTFEVTTTEKTTLKAPTMDVVAEQNALNVTGNPINLN
jgi:uncharacterized protein involved in type VI secretion and phage assembly